LNAYFLPGIGIYGGIKVGFQFASLLDRLGVPIMVATPEGDAPQWLASSVPVLSHRAALALLAADDPIIFSLPHDYTWLKASGHPLIFHCQGTDPLIDPVIADPDVLLLTCWQQAHEYVRERTGRDAIEVGISIADVFFYAGQPKRDGCVAYMPRRGADLAEHARQRCPWLEFVAIDGLDESATARCLHRSDYFLATSVGEWFGLPALEAMAAGCLVVSVPVIGGIEYLQHERTAIIAQPLALAEALASVSVDGQRLNRLHLRNAGIAQARAYRPHTQAQRLAGLLHGPLHVLT
jgi:hypothetical protein